MTSQPYLFFINSFSNIKDRIKASARAIGKVGAEVKKGYEAGLKNEAKITPMQDNNLFGNAYAG